jgi:hypothetical protein
MEEDEKNNKDRNSKRRRPTNSPAERMGLVLSQN